MSNTSMFLREGKIGKNYFDLILDAYKGNTLKLEIFDPQIDIEMCGFRIYTEFKEPRSIIHVIDTENGKDISKKIEKIKIMSDKSISIEFIK
jgi:hypothetical protein